MNKYLLYPTAYTMVQLKQNVATVQEAQCSHCPIVLKLNMEATTKLYSTITY